MKMFLTASALAILASSAHAEECFITVDGECMTEAQLESGLASVLQEYESRAASLERISDPQSRAKQVCVNHGTNYNTYITEQIRAKYVNWPDAVDLNRCFGSDEE